MFGGTTLGWYRECGIIPYTNDVDFASPIVEWNDNVEKMFTLNRRYALRTVFGLVLAHKRYNAARVILQPNDPLELTVGVGRRRIDLFFLYSDTNDNSSWVGGTSVQTREKFRYEVQSVLEVIP